MTAKPSDSLFLEDCRHDVVLAGRGPVITVNTGNVALSVVAVALELSANTIVHRV